jgi:hypothetical protein
VSSLFYINFKAKQSIQTHCGHFFPKIFLFISMRAAKGDRQSVADMEKMTEI